MSTRVERNDAANRYEVFSGDQLAGFAEYVEKDDRTIFTHTEIGEEFGGQGLGKVLAAGALDDTVGRGRVIVPLCPFIVGFLKKNHQYDEHVREDQGA